MTPITSMRAKTRRYITQLSLRDAVDTKYLSLSVTSFEQSRIPTPTNSLLRRQKGLVHYNHIIFPLSEWGTWKDTSYGIACCSINSTSSRCYILISLVFELFELKSTHERDDELVGYMITDLLREY